MNFFEAQDRARRRTAWMVFLFILAVAGLIGGLYFAFHLYLHGDAPAGVETVDKELLINSVLGVLAVVSVGTIYKTYVLSVGGGVWRWPNRWADGWCRRQPAIPMKDGC